MLLVTVLIILVETISDICLYLHYLLEDCHHLISSKKMYIPPLTHNI